MKNYWVSFTQHPVWAERRWLKWLGAGVGLAVFAYLLALSDNPIDWNGFYVAARSPLTPYAHGYPLHNPPWFAALLVPLGWLPFQVGRVINNFLIVSTATLLVKKLEGKALAVCATLLSPALLATTLVGNIEWMPIAGILIGGAWSVPLLLIKPQVTAILIPLEWRKAGYQLKFFIPIGVVLALSFLIWGWWPAQIPALPPDFRNWSFSLWPWSVPFGLGALWWAWRRDSLEWALLASLLLAPYFAIGSTLALTVVWACKYPRVVASVEIVFWGLIAWVLYFT